MPSARSLSGMGTYWAQHATRVGWFLAQYMVASRLSGRLTPPGSTNKPVPTLKALLRDLVDLLKRDRRCIVRGDYAAPSDVLEPRAVMLGNCVRYFLDVPAVNARRRLGGSDEVRRRGPWPKGFPDYSLRNFHFQTDGYLSAHSARLYDHQVEVLFFGSADAMRRQALPPVTSFVRSGRAGGTPVVVDVACGTGRFTAVLRKNLPQAVVIGLDVSEEYLREAVRQREADDGLVYTRGLGEALPFKDASIDVLTCIYLFHEVPGDVREDMICEFARTLKPGGRMVLVDSWQYGDRTDYEGLIDTFPIAFHEPFYHDYARCDLKALFANAGLTWVETRDAFLSKVMVFDRS